MVITFSTGFQKGHPSFGKQTFFMEKMINWYWDHVGSYHNVLEMFVKLNSKIPHQQLDALVDSMCTEVSSYKAHTARWGHRFKVGDKFDPRIWSGRPYASKQIQFLPQLEVQKVWDLQIKKKELFVNNQRVPANEIPFIANNDGLSFTDFMHWLKYPQPFDGQIICWNKDIEYEYNES